MKTRRHEKKLPDLLFPVPPIEFDPWDKLLDQWATHRLLECQPDLPLILKQGDRGQSLRLMRDRLVSLKATSIHFRSIRSICCGASFATLIALILVVLGLSSDSHSMFYNFVTSCILVQVVLAFILVDIKASNVREMLDELHQDWQSIPDAQVRANRLREIIGVSPNHEIEAIKIKGTRVMLFMTHRCMEAEQSDDEFFAEAEVQMNELGELLTFFGLIATMFSEHEPTSNRRQIDSSEVYQSDPADWWKYPMARPTDSDDGEETSGRP